MNSDIQRHHFVIAVSGHVGRNGSRLAERLLLEDAEAFLGAEELIQLVQEIRPEAAFLVILRQLGFCVIISLLKVFKRFRIAYRCNGISFLF